KPINLSGEKREQWLTELKKNTASYGANNSPQAPDLTSNDVRAVAEVPKHCVEQNSKPLDDSSSGTNTQKPEKEVEKPVVVKPTTKRVIDNPAPAVNPTPNVLRNAQAPVSVTELRKLFEGPKPNPQPASKANYQLAPKPN